ncbi:hypothetical protein CLOP_g4980 [Closterium sp. NIES-67]|nr:hypothetical protein CLOP_g4980 [Closterium sp. NIES-67]
MLNLRCLAVVFDLDETLFVANTMKSFEDKIGVLRQRLAANSDPQLAKLLAAELGRYEEDRQILLQYYDTNAVMLDGKCYVAEPEAVTPVDGQSLPPSRPVLRLPHQNIVLTRIFPENRDTSVLVRMRPSWDDLRSYFSTKGRKRFEAFVCTMAEKQYALEMWRLLDPEGKLIQPRELSARIISVKAGTLKSLQKVFHRNDSDPRMAVIIDDRINVWEERDQPRVHLVQPFAPYAAPLAEIGLPLPVLVHARNVICHVRTDFYRAIDEFLCQELASTFHDAELHQLPPIPDTAIFVKGVPVDDDVIESKEQQQWIFQYPGEKPLAQVADLDVPDRGAPRFGGPHLERVQATMDQPRNPAFPLAMDQPPGPEDDSEDLPAWQPDIPTGAPSELLNQLSEVSPGSTGVDKTGEVPAQPGTEEEVEEGELSDREDSDSRPHTEAESGSKHETTSTDSELEQRRRLLILQHGMDPTLAPDGSSLPPGFNLPGLPSSPALLPQSLAPQVPPLCDLAIRPSIVALQAAAPFSATAPSPRPSLMWAVKPLIEPSILVKAVSSEGITVRDESPAISPPGFGPPGFSALQSSVQSQALPLGGPPFKKALPPSLKRMTSYVNRTRQAPISNFSATLDAAGANSGAIVEYQHVAIGEREAPEFLATVLVDGEAIAEAQGTTIHVAQELASEKALHLISTWTGSINGTFERPAAESPGRARRDGGASSPDRNSQVPRSSSGRVTSSLHKRSVSQSEASKREASMIKFSSEMSSMQGSAKRQRLMGPS